MIKDNYIEIFDKYYHEQLSAVERQAFEAALAENQEIKLAFEQYQQTVAGIAAFERQQLKQQLLNARTQSSTRSTGRVIGMARHWGRVGVAASLALLVGLGLYWCNQSNDRLYADYELDKAENLMGFGTNEVINERQMFQMGLTFKEDDKLEAALSSFEKIEDENINLYFRAQYNMALIYLKIGEKQKSKTTLMGLSEHSENHYLKDKAEAMLKDLERFCYY